MNTDTFDAAIVNSEGIIENILVFDNEETMKEFGAFKITDGQRIGDKYITPEEYEIAKQKRQLTDIIETGILQL